MSVVEHVKHIYSCRKCEKDEINTPIKKADMPLPALPGRPASASAIAYIMSQKFVEGLPLYRQEKQWERFGVGLSRQTMSNWIIESSEKWLNPVYKVLREHLINKDLLFADETTLQVLKEPGRSANTTSYMWLYRTGRDGPPIILYDYQTTRASKHPIKFLENFRGFLQVDGYEAYSNIPNIKLVGCWAHAKRKFADALKAMPPKENLQKEKTVPTVAEEGIAYCDALFKIERSLNNCTNEERYNERLKHSRPILDSFYEWLKYQAPRVLPKSALGKAIQYCRNQWYKLEAFLQDGRLELSNNRAERAIKPFIIGRKNFLFCNTPKGAKSSATIYSIIETAKENNLNPFEYLKFLFERLPNMDIQDKNNMNEVMPWSTSLPDVCRVKKK